jgi:hypothetical protein
LPTRHPIKINQRLYGLGRPRTDCGRAQMMDDHLTLALMTKEALDHHQLLTFKENIFPEILTQILDTKMAK